MRRGSAAELALSPDRLARLQNQAALNQALGARFPINAISFKTVRLLPFLIVSDHQELVSKRNNNTACTHPCYCNGGLFDRVLRKGPAIKRTHHIIQHRACIAGVEAMTMLTEHSFPRHSHDQFGIGVMTVGAQRSWSGLGEVESRVGDIIMVNPGEMHDGGPMGGVRGWHIIYLDPGLVMREISEEPTTKDFTIRPVAEDPQLGAEILKFFRELTTPKIDHLAREEAVIACLARVMKRHGMDGPRNSTRSPSTLVAMQRLEDEPENSTSLADLASLCGLSRFQLLRGFSKEMGATPHAYLIQVRVRKARRLLAAGKSPVEAALLTGFADQSHLTRAFVRQFGVTPGRYQAAIS